MIKFFFIVLIIFFNHSLYSDTIENWSLIKNLKLSVFDNGYTNPVSMQFVKNSKKISKTTSYYVLDQSGKIFLSYNKEKIYLLILRKILVILNLLILKQ